MHNSIAELVKISVEGLSLSFDEYFARLTAMFDELCEVGVVVDDSELSLISHNGLDETYDSFVTTQIGRVDDISFDSLLGVLCSYKALLNHHSKVKGITTANSVQSSTTVVCQICKKKGHSALFCYNRHNKQHFPSKDLQVSFPDEQGIESFIFGGKCCLVF